MSRRAKEIYLREATEEFARDGDSVSENVTTTEPPAEEELELPRDLKARTEAARK
jgi:hypothetical protein